MLPNILVTATPGAGKSTLCTLLVHNLNKMYSAQFQHVDVSQLVKKYALHDGRDEQLDTLVVNDEALADHLERQVFEVTDGGIVIDYHSPSIVPRDYIDLVVILRCSNDVLYARLEDRKYSQVKIQENVEAEIMQVVRDEAYEWFTAAGDDYSMSEHCDEDEEEEEVGAVIVELANETEEQMHGNLQRIIQWVDEFIQADEHSVAEDEGDSMAVGQ